MRRIVIDCRGRLANQLLCWANARYVLPILGLGPSDRTIVIRHPIPHGTILLPGAVVEPDFDTSKLPRVSRNELAQTDTDVVWHWEDVYFQLPPDSVMRTILQSIELHPDFLAAIEVARGRIGVHARFGDYVKIDRKNPPDPMPPFVRADDAYFDKMMSYCLLLSPEEEFFLASDGTDEELRFLTDNFPIVRGKDPVFDLFALSRCCLLIGSNSTFTSVAATLGDVPFITPAMGADHALGIIKSALL